MLGTAADGPSLLFPSLPAPPPPKNSRQDSSAPPPSASPSLGPNKEEDLLQTALDLDAQDLTSPIDRAEAKLSEALLSAVGDLNFDAKTQEGGLSYLANAFKVVPFLFSHHFRSVSSLHKKKRSPLHAIVHLLKALQCLNRL